MNRLQEIEARLAAIANEIEQRGAELTAEQLTAFETEVNNLKTERAGLVAAAGQHGIPPRVYGIRPSRHAYSRRVPRGRCFQNRGKWRGDPDNRS